jgi:hypothetical protein
VRGIAIPVELENQLQTLFAKLMLTQKHSKTWLAASKNRIENIATQNSDQRIIVEGLQVC